MIDYALNIAKLCNSKQKQLALPFRSRLATIAENISDWYSAEGTWYSC